MAKTNTQVMEDELKRLRGPYYQPPLTAEEIAVSMRFLCNNPIPSADVEAFLKAKGLT